MVPKVSPISGKYPLTQLLVFAAGEHFLLPELPSTESRKQNPGEQLHLLHLNPPWFSNMTFQDVLVPLGAIAGQCRTGLSDMQRDRAGGRALPR